MAATAQAMSRSTVPQGRSVTGINFRLFLGMMLVMSVVYASARMYQQMFAWTAGLDSASPEFHAYWMRLFYIEIALEAVAAAGIWGWLWRTRDRHMEDLRPREELHRWFRLIAWLSFYTFSVMWTGFFAEQDATWHQTVIRDTEFTPSHIILFFFCMPVFIIVGVSSFLYGRTRLPMFANAISLPFVIAVAGPFMMLPNVAFNEWGHTFWIMEEIFSAPLHAGFVIFAWAALALGGLLAQAIGRVIDLLTIVGREEGRSLTAA